MIHTLINFFKISLYSEPDFFISKQDETHFSVNASNGLKASIVISDNIMFVDVYCSEEIKAVTRYCTPFLGSLLSVDDFVVHNIKSTIFFKLSKNEFNAYIDKYVNIFKDFYHTYNHIYSLHALKIMPHNFDDYIEKDDGHLYEYFKHEKNKYPHVTFTRKKIIKNVFRYSFKAISRDVMFGIDNGNSYLIGNYFFNVCTLQEFIKDKTHADYERHSFNITDWSCGINNQLSQHFEIYADNINSNNILLLKQGKDKYCYIEKKKNKLVLSYLTSFDEKNTVIEQYLSYSSAWEKFCRNETPIRRYKNERLLTYTYCNGKVKKRSSKFSIDDAQQYEMGISNSVMIKLDRLKLKYPATCIIQRLASLGMACKTPLNPDDLLVLEMNDI
jgi:hypothetical protein